MLPKWAISATYNEAEYAYHQGRLTRDEWQGYRALWRYGALRFSDTVPWPPVRAIVAALDAGAAVISIEWDKGTSEACEQTWPLTFAD